MLVVELWLRQIDVLSMPCLKYIFRLLPRKQRYAINPGVKQIRTRKGFIDGISGALDHPRAKLVRVLRDVPATDQ